MRRGRPREPGPGLFRDIVLAPDRETIPGVAPLVSFAEGDASEFLSEVRRRSIRSCALVRRGIDHGVVAELRAEGIVGPRPRRRRREALESERWCSARPIFLSAVAEEVREDELAARLRRTGGLREHLAARESALQGEFTVSPRDAELFDPERDIARVVMRASNSDALDLWIKVARLSTHDADVSVRMRVSFGCEGDDDASADEARHEAVAHLGRIILPGARALDANASWREVVERHVGRKVLATQQIAYWNAPGGGARFHHDAFGEADGQLGVVYAQLSGRTIWLALSIEELAGRLREFVGWIEAGDLSWLREALGDLWRDVLERVEKRAPCLEQLAAPDCGVFDRIVNAPEFTRFLADAGHAISVGAGDILLLPNHGLGRTAMHSVFSGSRETGYALSMAIR